MNEIRKRKEGETLIDEIFLQFCDLIEDSIIVLANGIVWFLKWVAPKIFKGLKGKPKVLRINALTCKKKTENFKAIGVDCTTKKVVPFSSINTTKHNFIVGASGSGKTNLINLLIRNSLRNQRPVIFLDPKADRESYKMFKDMCHAYSIPTYAFSEFEIDFFAINPIKDGSINQVTDRIMNAFNWSEEFYKEECAEALEDSLQILKEEGRSFTFENIQELLQKRKDQLNIKGLINKIKRINKSDYGKMLNTEGAMSISDLRRNNFALYIGVSTQGYADTAKALGKIFLGDFLYHSYWYLSQTEETRKQYKPVSVIFDEFGSVAMEHFIELLNKCRGSEMELTMAIQTLSDLESVHPTFFKQVIENCNNIFILKQMVDDAVGFLAKSAGTITTEKLTSVAEDGVSTGRTSVREVEQLVINPNIIKNLKVGQCVHVTFSPKKEMILNLRYEKARWRNLLWKVKKVSPMMVEAMKKRKLLEENDPDFSKEIQ